MKVKSIYIVPSKSIHSGTVAQWELFREDEFLSSLNVFNANILNPGMAMEPHQHESEEQMYFMLSGVGIIKVGDEEREVREGDAIYLPPRLSHTMRNMGTYPLRFLTIGAKIK